MGQLVRVSFSVHRVREVLSMRCLGHGRPSIVAHTSSRALNAWVLRSNSSYASDVSRVGIISAWGFRRATMVDSLGSWSCWMSLAVLY